jgi:hypothetical protein
MSKEFSEHQANASGVDAVQRFKALVKRAAHDPKVKAALEKANREIVEKGLSGAVHVDSTLAQLSVQYRNEAYIGEQLMPIVQVDHKSNTFFKYGKNDRLSAPDDSMSARSEPNEIFETRTTDNYSTKPYALKDFLDLSDVSNHDAPLNEMIDAVAAVNEALALQQEKRHAAVLTAAGNYAPGNTVTLSGTSQWSDYVSGVSSPYDVVATARDAIWSGNGPSRLIGFCPNTVYNKLRRHPQVVTDFKHMQGLKLPTRQQLAEYLELDDLLVAKAWENTANEGQAASLGRIWGKHFGIVRVATAPSTRSASFGYTFRFGAKTTDEWFDKGKGVKGGYFCRVGHEVDEKVVAGDTGYLIVNAVA